MEEGYIYREKTMSKRAGRKSTKSAHETVFI